MSIFSRATGRSVAKRDSDPWNVPPPGAAFGMGTPSGVAVSPRTSMQLSAVWACVRLISGTLSGLPLEAYDEKTNQRVKKQPPLVVNPFGLGDPYATVLETRKRGMQQVMISLLLSGNAFFEVPDRDMRGTPLNLSIVSPDRVSWRLDSQTRQVKYYLVDGHQVDTRSFLHLPGMTWPGESIGMSVISYCRRSLGLGIAAEEYGSRFFSQGGTLSGVIEAPESMDKVKARKMRAAWDASHIGLANSHFVGVLTGGAKFQKVGVTPDEAQFLGSRSMSTVDIAMMFGVPPHMLGQVDRTTSWGKGIEEQTLGFLKYNMKDWTDTISDFFSGLLREGVSSRFDFGDLLAPDSTTRFTAYQFARNASIMTINEIRGREGLPPIEGVGDDVMAPLNSAHSNDPGFSQPNDPATAGSAVTNPNGDNSNG